MEAYRKPRNLAEMVAYRKMASVVASAVAATLIVIVKDIRKKMIIQKAVADRNIMMNLKPRGYSPRDMEERPPYSMSTWGRVLVNPRCKNPVIRKGEFYLRDDSVYRILCSNRLWI